MKPAWTITSVVDATIFDAQRGPQPAKRVEFQLMDGTRSQVLIADSAFNATEVNRRVDDAAKNLYEVLTLRGPDIPTGEQGGS